MAVTINGTTGITTPDLTSTDDISANGVPFGKGGGSVSSNIAIGTNALAANTTGAYNVSLGRFSGVSNTTSTRNTFVGDTCGYYTTGGSNTFIGTDSGYAVTTGTKNAILGTYSGNQGGLDIRTSSNYIVLSDGDGNPAGLFGNGYNRISSAYNNYYTSNSKGGTVTLIGRDTLFPSFSNINSCTIIINADSSEGTAGGLTRTDILHVNYRFGYTVSSLATNTNDGIGITTWSYSFDATGLKVTQNWSGGSSTMGTKWSFLIVGGQSQG